MDNCRNRVDIKLWYNQTQNCNNIFHKKKTCSSLFMLFLFVPVLYHLPILHDHLVNLSFLVAKILCKFKFRYKIFWIWVQSRFYSYPALMLHDFFRWFSTVFLLQLKIASLTLSSKLLVPLRSKVWTKTFKIFLSFFFCS